MKKALLTLLSVLFCVITFAQTVPQGINYQAIVRDSSGNLLSNSSLSLRVSIVADSATGFIDYQEVHNVTTNNLGLITFIIGQGTVISGTFSGLQWKFHLYLLKLEADFGMGYVLLSLDPLMAVPYALNSGGGGGGNTLDQAYDEGVNPGDGRVINADAGAVKIDLAGGNTPALDIATSGTGDGIRIDDPINKDAIVIGNVNPISGIGRGVFIDHGGSGDGIRIEHTAGGDGISIRHTDDGHGIDIDQIGSGDGIEVDKSNSDGHAGNFHISNIQNNKSALKGGTEGTQVGVYGYYTNPPTSLAPNQLAQPFKEGGVVGQSFNTDDGQAIPTKQRVGVAGGSENSSGVYGRHLGSISGTYSTGAPNKIVAGVLGRTPAINTADNWGVAGIGDGYGSGVLGIGWYEHGIGVLGVSGDQADHMTAGVWGIARESTLFNVIAQWPLEPYPDNNSIPKQEVGVLGQADDRVAVWGESLQHVGVVGTAGGRFGFSSITVDAGIFAKGEGNDTYGLYAESKDYYGIHGVSEADSTFTTAGVKAEGMGDRDKAAALEIKNGAIRVTGANKPAGSRTKVCSFMMNPPVFASPNFMSSQQNAPEFHGDHMIAGSDTIHISNALIDANRSLVFLTIGSVENLIPVMNPPPVTANITSQSDGEIVVTVWAFGNPLDLGQVSITLNYFIINE
jgi:hypothetical protein